MLGAVLTVAASTTCAAWLHCCCDHLLLCSHCANHATLAFLVPSCCSVAVCVFSIRANNISADGAVAIAEAMKSNSTLHTLE